MIQVLIALVIVGIAAYFLLPYVAEPFRKMIIVVVVLFFCLWLLGIFGIVPMPAGMK